jgi:hypothetical protein
MVLKARSVRAEERATVSDASDLLLHRLLIAGVTAADVDLFGSPFELFDSSDLCLGLIEI